MTFLHAPDMKLKPVMKLAPFTRFTAKLGLDKTAPRIPNFNLGVVHSADRQVCHKMYNNSTRMANIYSRYY